MVQIVLVCFSSLLLSLISFLFCDLLPFIFLTSLHPTLTLIISAMSVMPEHQHHNHTNALALPDHSGAVPTSTEARAKRCIAALEEELFMMKQERGTKQRFVMVVYYLTHSMPLAY
jgi:hypothetical protein